MEKKAKPGVVVDVIQLRYDRVYNTSDGKTAQGENKTDIQQTLISLPALRFQHAYLRLDVTNNRVLSEFGWINPEVKILPLNSESPVQRLLQPPFEGLSKVVYRRSSCSLAWYLLIVWLSHSHQSRLIYILVVHR